MICSISWKDILHIWQTELWPNRASAIEQTSAMKYLQGHDIKNMEYYASFFGFIVEGQLVAVNSGHWCHDKSYRSRGLWVNPEYRRHGIGSQLLTATVRQGLVEGAEYVWSFPRKSSWPTYQRAGFKLTSDWQESETSEANAYCIYDR